MAGLIVAGLAWAAFPVALNNWSYDDVITEDWANSLEATIGITGSAVSSSHDYRISTLENKYDLRSNWRYLTVNALTPTSTIGIIVSASSTFGYINASGFTGNASTADALKANGTNCSANQYPLGIDASGNVETCTADANTTYTADNPVILTGTVFGINNTSSTNWDTAYGWGNHASLNYLTQALATTTYLTKSKYFSTTTWAGGDNKLIVGSGGFLSQASSTFSNTVDFSGGTITGMFLYPAFTYATSSWVGTTTIALGTAFVPETWSSVQCFTTAGSLSLRFGDGTNKMNWVVASTTVGQTALSTNNTFTAQETRYVDLGSASGAVQVSCTIKKNY